MIPGEYKLSDKTVTYNEGYDAISLEVKNLGDRAVQVGSIIFMKPTKKV